MEASKRLMLEIFRIQYIPLFYLKNKQIKKRWRKLYGKRVLSLYQRTKGKSQ